MFAHTTLAGMLAAVLNVRPEHVHQEFVYGEHVSDAITEEIGTDITVPDSKFQGGPDFDFNASLINPLRRFVPYVLDVR